MPISYTMISRKQLTQVIWGLVLVVIVLDVMVYVRRHIAYSSCDISQLKNSTSFLGGLPLHAMVGLQGRGNSSVICQPHIPCEYPEDVDFRIIVMTYKRTESLQKVLKSLDHIELDGDRAALEIFIDRDKSGNVHEQTVQAAKDYQWSLGQTRVHVWSKHVGIYGQWIDSWKPKNGSNEIALILEDDMSVSKYCYRWLKAAHKAYDHRTDISGYTLQGQMTSAIGGKTISAPKEHPAFLYKVLGSWGFSPHPKSWQNFQDWYYTVKNNKSFHPYVPDIVMTSWYKSFEKNGKSDSMWTMWHIYFTDKKNMFCLINNLDKHIGSQKAHLGVNRQEPGLHYGGKGVDNTGKLLTSWDEKYVKFPENPLKFGYNGKAL